MELKSFQIEASEQIAERYESYMNDPLYIRKNEIVPFYQNLSAITGAGKTLVLADAIEQIRAMTTTQPVVLWLSKGKVVVGQTFENLSNGKYADNIPSYTIKPLLDCKGRDILDDSKGLILVATVGKFNQKDKEDGDRKIFQTGLDEASESLWEILKRRENDKGKLEQLNKEIADLKDEETKQKAQWQSEKEQINKIQQNKIDIENLKFEADKAEREGDYGKVAEIRYGKIKQKEEEIREVQEKLKTMQGASAMIKEEVDSEDIADVVSRWTGIPVSKMMQSEKEKLLHLESELHTRVIGQEEAISAIADAVRRSRAGLQDPKRPIGSFIFLGTTGVGKTELAKALAEYLFDDENMMTRIDMSEYQEKFSATRLIGAPPGYVGYDEGGQLTEAIRRKPYSVVLFDEIEKAHPDVFNILLQVLDDGRLTDNKGRVVNFKNTIIIMTSNMGSSLIRENFEKMTPETHDQVVDETKIQVLELLKKTIRPEFLNRIDDIIMFTPLNEEEIRKIVTVQLNSVKKMLAQNGIALEFTDAALAFISDKGFDPQFGARPVKRVIQKYVLNELSKELLGGKINKDRPITIDSNGAGLVFKN